MSLYIQLGGSGSFVAPCNGWAVFQCIDGVRYDNSGSLAGTLGGDPYTALCELDTAGPYLVEGLTYYYDFPDTEYWNVGSGASFNADGDPEAGNPSPYTSANGYPATFMSGVWIGLKAFSLVLRIDAPEYNMTQDQRIFSTGRIYVVPPVTAATPTSLIPNTALTATYTNNSGALGLNAPATVLGAASGGINLKSHALATDLPAVFDWLQVSLAGLFGAASLALELITGAADNLTVRVWGASGPGMLPGAAGTLLIGTEAIVATGAAQAVAVTFAPVDVPVKYILIEIVQTTPAELTLYAFALTAIRAIELGEIQSAKWTLAGNPKQLFTSAMVTRFAVDCGMHMMKSTLAIGHAGIHADALQLLWASVLLVTGAMEPYTYAHTLGPVMQIKNYAVEYDFVDNSPAHKTITLTMLNCQSDGLEIPYKLADFAIGSFVAEAYEDAYGLYGTIALQQ